MLQLLEYEEVPPESPPKKKSKITVKSLLKSLDHESDFAQKDLDYCLKLGFSETDHFQDRAAWALQAPEVAKFLDGKTGSRFLLINGNDDATQFISPLSYVCAKLADWLSESSSVIQLKYFCSCHPDDWSEPRANAQGIVAQLMGQLLCEPAKNGKKKSFKLDLSEIGTEDESALARDNFGATWRTFEHLVKQLPKGMRVFCFIDGLSAYENSTRKKDISRLMRKMCKLIGSIKNIDLRCMVTCPGRSSHDDTWGVEFDGRKSKAVKLDMPEYI